MRIAPDGTVLDDRPIAIHNTGYKPAFALTANGPEWLVALQSSGAGESDLRAVRVSAAGAVVNPGGTQLLDPPTLITFDVVSAQGEYLLVWSNSSNLEGRRYAADLMPIGAPFSVPGTRVASNGTDYFLVWTSGGFLVGSPMSLTGVLQNPTGAPIASSTGLVVPPDIQVAWDGTVWWTSWRQAVQGILFARTSAAGAVLDFGGIPLNPALGAVMRDHELAGGPLGGAQIVWKDSGGGGPNPYDIFTAPVSATAAPGPDMALSVSTPAQLRADLAEGAGEVLAVFLSEHSGPGRIVGQRLSADGLPLDAEPFEIATGPIIDTPHVAWNGSLFLVVWSKNGQIVGRRVLPDGTVLDPTPLAIMSGSSPDVAALDGTFLVVGTQPTISVHFFHPFALRVDGATGATLDPEPILLGQYFARVPRVTTFAGRWLATWQRNFSHDDIHSNIMAAFVDADGTTPGEFIVEYMGGTPDVATSASAALFAWRSSTPGSINADIKGRLMLPDGTFASTSLAIANGVDEQVDPSVAWNGAEFVVAWADKRDTVIYFDERTEVLAARVEENGALIDPAGFTFGNLALSEMRPVVGTLGGRTLLAASVFRSEPAFGSYRIGYQLLGDPLTGNRWPVAVVSADTAGGEAPLTVGFRSLGSSDPDGVLVTTVWDFGDGTGSAAANPTHTYVVPGDYMAALTVTDNQGARTTNSVRVRVRPVNQPPVAVASATPTSGKAPLSVVYRAAGSYDPDDGIQTYRWDFGDGWIYYGGTAYHTYSAPGTYVTTLTVIDHWGANATDTVTIQVGAPQQPPVAVASATPTTGVSPLSVDFSSAGSYDPDGFLVAWSWNFGDGTSSAEADPTHVYLSGGAYLATLTVTDNEGAIAAGTVRIDVTQGSVENLAADYATAHGAITAGSYLDTHARDGVYEALTEEATGGNPTRRRSLLEHTWQFQVTSGVAYTFVVDAYRAANTEGDDFPFSYSRDGITFAPMLTVTRTAPGAAPETFAFPENVSGTLFIRVEDTDRTPGRSGLDTLFVDGMVVVTSSVDGGGPPPPGGERSAVHIADIVVSSVNLGQGWKLGRAEVLVVDDLGSPVAGASVTGSFSGGLTETRTETTDASGVAVFATTTSVKGSLSFTFCVVGVTVTDATPPYDQMADVETCATF